MTKNSSPEITRTRLVTIGVLAHNEADVIERTLAGIFRQTLIKSAENGAHAEYRVEVVVVPNGCTDATADLAERALQVRFSHVDASRVYWAVHSLDRGGKANAWNEFMHRLSDQNADLIILMDADIDLYADDTLERVVRTLDAEPAAHAAVGCPVKSIARRGWKSLLERASLMLSSVQKHGAVELNGGLYGARPILRRVWLPEGLLVEDGFIKAMLVTDFFTHQTDKGRLVRAEGAVYEFDAYIRPMQLLRHQRRLITGSITNSYLYSRLWGRPAGTDAAEYLRRVLDADARWVQTVVRESCGGRFWCIPKGYVASYVRKRWRKLRGLSPGRRFASTPVVLTYLAISIPLMFAVNLELRKASPRW